MAPWHCELVERTHRRGVESAAFTLIELFVVMAVVIILLGLAFPAFNSVQNSARKTQAKNDLVQIVTAVNAFYTEYGKYPLATADTTYVDASNALLLNELRAVTPSQNPRGIVFISPPFAKDTANPRSGIGLNNQYYDPWGRTYRIEIDGNYDNQISNPYTANTGAGPGILSQGVIAWSLGKVPTAVQNFAATDDVISWQ